ncbi:hypothetical protein B9479_004592 [Cryptococcus floricola]|uniref:DUF6534 domain-containing protein n=1 Tax=Cryptococcus floricola TaxID=2591691 RepID=A0A5D3AVY0_9TREE|nr:hypothetical protein B9479_004592 [Cryptococcus floricola]
MYSAVLLGLGKQTGQIGGYNESAAAELFASETGLMLMVIDTFMAGILVMQLLKYFMNQNKDLLSTKLIIAWSSAWTLVVSVFIHVHVAYLFIPNFGLWLPWLEVRWIATMPIFDILAVLPIQCFFANRAYLLTERNNYLLGCVSILLLASAGGAIGLTVVFGTQETSLIGIESSGAPLITWIATTFAADALIAASIIYGLFKSKTEWLQTHGFIPRWVRLSFEAQLPPTILALAYCIDWSIEPTSQVGAVFQCLQSKLYLIGMLYTVNSRIVCDVHANNDTPVVTVPTRAHGMTDFDSLMNDIRSTQAPIDVQDGPELESINEKSEKIENSSRTYAASDIGPTEKSNLADLGSDGQTMTRRTA